MKVWIVCEARYSDRNGYTCGAPLCTFSSFEGAKNWAHNAPRTKEYGIMPMEVKED